MSQTDLGTLRGRKLGRNVRMKSLRRTGEIIAPDERKTGIGARVQVQYQAWRHHTLIACESLHHASNIHGDETRPPPSARTLLRITPIVVD